MRIPLGGIHPEFKLSTESGNTIVNRINWVTNFHKWSESKMPTDHEHQEGSAQHLRSMEQRNSHRKFYYHSINVILLEVFC